MQITGLTANFLNHFFTSELTASHSLSAVLTNFESTSQSVSNMVALTLRALASKALSNLTRLMFYSRTWYVRDILYCRCIAQGLDELSLKGNNCVRGLAVIVQDVHDRFQGLA